MHRLLRQARSEAAAQHVAGFFTTVTRLVTCPFFKIEKVRFTEGVEEPVPYDQPVVWMMLEGEAERARGRCEGADDLHARRDGSAPGGDEESDHQDDDGLSWLEVTFPTSS